MAADYAALKKGGFMRQKQKNCFSMRLKVVGGQVTAKQLATVAEIADKYGHGYVHLTSRQGIEIPFIQLDDIDAVKEEMAKGNVEGGTFGNDIYKGEEIIPMIHGEETLFRVMDAAIEFFAEYANKGERFRKTLERVGIDALKARIEEAYHG